MCRLPNVTAHRIKMTRYLTNYFGFEPVEAEWVRDNESDMGMRAKEFPKGNEIVPINLYQVAFYCRFSTW